MYRPSNRAFVFDLLVQASTHDFIGFELLMMFLRLTLNFLPKMGALFVNFFGQKFGQNLVFGLCFGCGKFVFYA